MERTLWCSWKYSYAFVKAMYDWRIKLVMSDSTENYDSIVDYQLEDVDITDERVYAVRNWETEASLDDFRDSYYSDFEPNLEDFEYCGDDDYYYNMNDWDWEIINSESLEECVADIESYYEIDVLSVDDMVSIEAVFNKAQEYKREEEERKKKNEEERRQLNSYKVYSHI